MKDKRIDALEVWKQIEDVLAPRLKLTPIDRVVYAHLMRRRLEGKRRLWFSIRGVAQSIRLSHTPVRRAVRRLVGHGALRLVERGKAGHVVEVRLPENFRPAASTASAAAPPWAAPRTSRTWISCKLPRGAI